MTDFPLRFAGSGNPIPPTISDRKILRAKRFSTAAIACIVQFFVAVGLAAWLHPHIPVFLVVFTVAMPVGGVGFGVLGRRNHAVVRAPRRANVAVRIGVVLVIGVIGILILLPNLCRTREPALVGKCHANIRNIWAGIQTYRQAHGGEYPPTLAALIVDPATGYPPDILVCPSNLNDSPADRHASAADLASQLEDPHHVSYVYVPPTFAGATVPQVILYERAENHHGAHLHVLYSDGQINYITVQEAKDLLPGFEAPASPAESRW